MAGLTPQMEKFCSGISAGLSQADAYRDAYPKSKAWKPETLHPQASKMMADHKIVARVAELRAELSKISLWSREMSVRALMETYEIARGQMQPGAMTGAVRELNLMHGYNAPVQQDKTPADVLADALSRLADRLPV